MGNHMTKFLCSECDWHGSEAKVLRAPNPFAEDDSETMQGCPKCREPNTMRLVCDDPTCWREATCGIPTPKGYRRVCGEHWRTLDLTGAALDEQGTL